MNNKKMKRKDVIIMVLVIILIGCAVGWSIKVTREDYYKQGISEGQLALAFAQAQQRILFYPVIQTQDNQTILQSITWQELCQGG